MKPYYRGCLVGIVAAVLIQAGYNAVHEDPTRYKWADIQREIDNSEATIKGLDDDLGLPQQNLDGFTTAPPLASLYKATPILDLTPDIVEEVCIAGAFKDQFDNEQWQVAIRFKNKSLLDDLYEQNGVFTDPENAPYGVLRFGSDSDILKFGKFDQEHAQNYAKQASPPNHGDLHLFFGKAGHDSLLSILPRLSPTGDVLPCHEDIDMVQYRKWPQWRRSNNEIVDLSETSSQH